MSMSADRKTAGPSAETVRVIAELRGLGRVQALSPDIVAAAFERGRRPIGSFPKNFSPVTEPASRFTVTPGNSE
jgi:hypothetical protein